MVDATHSVVVPGQMLGEASTLRADVGTYVWGHRIYASLAGLCAIDDSQQPPRVSVRIAQRGAPHGLPVVDDMVTCRVTRLNPRMAHVDIICVDGAVLREPCQGILHREDVRDFDVDQVEMYHSFRPGDVIQARVTSLGDSRSYYITRGAIAWRVANAAVSCVSRTTLNVSLPRHLLPSTHR
mmetsp:Transcript_3182/g.6663  ORF Transcript_3182/g.6663 Transcript_3182/m.6663 type:complete len:182 (-) Transcript_3182:304-849(-)